MHTLIHLFFILFLFCSCADQTETNEKHKPERDNAIKMCKDLCSNDHYMFKFSMNCNMCSICICSDTKLVPNIRAEEVQ